MVALLEGPDTVVPSREDAELAAELSRKLATKRPEDSLCVRLGDGQELILPEHVARLLSHILTEMSHGNAVRLIPVHAELTTQEAADYLNVSRPYLVKLLEERKIPFRMVGTHRRVQFHDLERYAHEAAAARDKALAALAEQAQELDMGY